MQLAAIHLLPPFALATLVLLSMVVAIEVGYRIGLRTRRRASDPEAIVKRDVTLGAMLALLGLLLAFTYSFSLSRADLRKEAVLAEANALSTAFLRADLVDEPARSALRRALYDYARTRVVLQEQVRTKEQLEAVIAHSEAAQRKLWPVLSQAVQVDTPGPLQNALVQSITEVLDLHTTRLSRVGDRLPEVVFWLMVLVAAGALAVAAHNGGLAGRISRSRMAVFAIVLSALIAVIMDFDQPQRGTITISQAPIEMTVKSMADDLAAEGQRMH
ncbi:hypothetical protein [Thiohalocapsa sp.]|jgi:hypothetical protein|uniref:bestrophin-like domain n=1 Tax=Thiohalocapsa sp. TaxID=2497641 RepID=UPI0025EA7B1B|nr:hypothetical protein [Thiohalocapsa sp.]